MKNEALVKRMMEWVDGLKRRSDNGQHMNIPSGLSAGTCWELANELEQFIQAALEANKFNPDWDTQAVLVEEIQRMAKRIEELEAQRKPLTDEEINNLDKWLEQAPYWRVLKLARAIEAAHGITGENT